MHTFKIKELSHYVCFSTYKKKIIKKWVQNNCSLLGMGNKNPRTIDGISIAFLIYTRGVDIVELCIEVFVNNNKYLVLEWT